MHLYIITRGMKTEVDRFVNDMSAQYFPIFIDGKPAYVQLAMRPIQLWEMVFPEESLGEVIATIRRDPGGSANRLGYAKRFGLQKMLGCKPIPKLLNLSKKRIVYNHNIAIEEIGIKKDRKTTERKFADDGRTELL